MFHQGSFSDYDRRPRLNEYLSVFFVNDPVKSIVIVGGGSAGWLTAGVIAAEHRSGSETGIKVTLIESPDIKTIGVGEGTWPTMRETLHRVGVSETDFVRECDVSLKQGTKFVDWVTGDSGDFFFQPFTPPQGYFDCNLAPHWLAGSGDMSFSNAVCFQEQICERGLAPKLITTPEYEAVANYAYHLNAGKLGGFLQKHCVERLGVNHVLDDVTEIVSSANGDIKSLQTGNNGEIEADLYIDCSGFASLLLGTHLGVPFVDKADVLFIDSALAMQVPYAGEDAPIASQTISTAREAGWIWDIGLSSRRGVGYVYASRYIDDEAAEVQLREYLRESIGDEADDIAARKIPITAGHREIFWKNNCVAVGLSAGFLEPLEASALALIEYSARFVADRLPANRRVMDIVARQFNDNMLYHWGRVIDFLKLHYVLSKRNEPFWADNRLPDTIPQSLQDLLAVWRYRCPEHDEFSHTEEVFPAAGYQYVLYGMGFETEIPAYARKSQDIARANRLFRVNRELTRKYAAEMPDNRELLGKIHKYGMQTI